MLQNKKFDGLMILIAFMAIVVCVLIVAVKIKQGSDNKIDEVNSVVEEQLETEEVVTPEPEPEIVVEEEPIEIIMVRATTLVNIRAEASVSSTKLVTVDSGTEFQLIEQMENGWTKIVYLEGEAYIKSDYVELIENIQ